MVDMTSNPDNPRLVITDTEYSMSESQRVQWFGAGRYAYVNTYDPAILTMSGSGRALTEETLRKIRALDRGRLVATVREFYPDLGAADLLTFEKRINFLKENAEALRYKGLQGIWNEYFIYGGSYGQDGKKIFTTPSYGGYGGFGFPSVPSGGAWWQN